MAKKPEDSRKIVFGSKKGGRHYKSFGPRVERPKKYRGQGR